MDGSKTGYGALGGLYCVPYLLLTQRGNEDPLPKLYVTSGVRGGVIDEAEVLWKEHLSSFLLSFLSSISFFYSGTIFSLVDHLKQLILRPQDGAHELDTD